MLVRPNYNYSTLVIKSRIQGIRNCMTHCEDKLKSGNLLTESNLIFIEAKSKLHKNPRNGFAK